MNYTPQKKKSLTFVFSACYRQADQAAPSFFSPNPSTRTSICFWVTKLVIRGKT